MGDRIPEENIPQADGTAGSTETVKAARTGKITKKALTSRGVLLIGIGGLLTALLIVGAVAWYTRISMVNQMTMDAAKFDFKANYSGGYVIQADDYISLYGDNKAAPGTSGVIPILIQAGESQTDISYSLCVDTSDMDQSFKRRLRFFYIPSDADMSTYDVSKEKECNELDPIEGKIVVGDTAPHYEYIYWEWVYDLNDKLFYSTPSSAWQRTPGTEQTDLFYQIFGGKTAGDPVTEEHEKKVQAAKDAFDEMDTDIGLGKRDNEFVSPDTGKTYATSSEIMFKVDPNTHTYEQVTETMKAYQTAMTCKIDIVGAEAKMVYSRDPGSLTHASGCGSKYVDLETVINAHSARYE